MKSGINNYLSNPETVFIEFRDFDFVAELWSTYFN